MNDNKVLLGERKGSHGAGSWSFPGGHIEMFEDLRVCAMRELEEETGFAEGNVKFIDKYSVATTNDFFPEENKHYITLFMRAKYDKGIPVVKEKDKCMGWQWFNLDELVNKGYKYRLFTPIKNLIEQGYDPFGGVK